ncbi:MAG: hypothetical protein GX589_03115 [Deltaproteobacteria bacterium]|nr:hypothetical protein [Deltaproteobacteria bacterium]
MRAVFACIFLVTFLGCGRYGPPLPPEEFSPRAVQDLKVVPGLQGVDFAWSAPSSDRRGKELKEIEGYRVYRKEIVKRSDILDDSVSFELLTSIPDSHLEVLEDLRIEARKQGQIGRKVTLDDHLLDFKYSDQTVVPGVTYLYKIVPYNQGGVEGEFLGYVKIVFRGESSEVSFLEQTAEEEKFKRNRPS